MASVLHQLHSCAQWSAHSYLSLQLLYHGAALPLTMISSTLWGIEAFCVCVRVDGHMANIKSQKELMCLFGKSPTKTSLEPGVGSILILFFIDYSAVCMQNSVITKTRPLRV